MAVAAPELLKPFAQPCVLAADGGDVEFLVRGAAGHRLERFAHGRVGQLDLAAAPTHVVAHHQPFVAVEQPEATGEGLDRVGEAAAVEAIAILAQTPACPFAQQPVGHRSPFHKCYGGRFGISRA